MAGGPGEAQPPLVCAQQRLYAAFMYTDDPVVVVVGADRALRALRVWRGLTDDVRLIMAIAEKRTLGSWTLWLGVILVASLGLAVVPTGKILRAAGEICDCRAAAELARASP